MRAPGSGISAAGSRDLAADSRGLRGRRLPVHEDDVTQGTSVANNPRRTDQAGLIGMGAEPVERNHLGATYEREAEDAHL